MSQVQASVFVRSKDSSVSGSVIKGHSPHCVLDVQTESVSLNIHFDSLTELETFIHRACLAADAIHDALRDPSDDTITLGPAADPVRVGGIDLSEPAGPLTVLPE